MRVWRLGRTALLAVLIACVASAAQARWLRAESPLFIVYSDGDEQGVRTFTDQLEQFDAFLRLITGTKAPPAAQKLTVYLVAGHHQLSVIYPAAAPEVYGFYNARPSGIEAVAIRAVDDQLLISGQQVLFHEYTHHFMMQYFPGFYPLWYQEGFAEFCSTVTFKPEGIEFGRAIPNRMGWLTTSGRWLPVEQLLAPPSPKTSKNELFYPEAWLATHYLLRHPEEQQKMKAYIVALRHGEAPAPAFQRAFGMDFDAFDKVLSNYLSKGLTYTRVKLPNKTAPASIAVTSMPPSADKLLLDYARLVAEEVADKDKAGFVAQVRADAAQFPGDSLALRTLALAEIQAGDPAAADAPVDTLLQDYPDDTQALYLKGLRYMMAGWKDKPNRATWYPKARPYLARAYRIDPHYSPALWLLGESLDPTEEGVPSDNVLNALGNAHLLSPQVPEISMDDAKALMRAQRYAEAVDVLEDVAHAPHGSERGAEALKMLEQAKAHLAKPDAPVTLPPMPKGG
jgi:tetratricopeptide (TPR) repeat protein